MAEDTNANIRVDTDTAAALASIKNLQRQISAFHTNMAKGGAAAAATSLNLQQGLLNSINRTGQFSATIKNVKSTTESFTNSLEKNKLSMREYFRYSGAATKTFGRFFVNEFDTINKVARERVKDLQTQYIKMGRDANGALRAIAVRPLALDMENLSTKTQIAAQRQALLNQMLKQGSTNLLNFGKNTQWAGRQLMVGFTVPLVMFGTVAAKTFMDMEKQAIRFKRVYGEMFTTTEETNKALQEIKNLASEFTKYGIAVSKTMELAADIAATGKMGAELTAQVAQATRLAVLGGVEQAEALKATISLTDAFGTSAEELAGKIDFLNAVENQTVTSIEDLTIAIPKAGPVVQQLGGDVKDLTFFLTAMREGGINASEGANALKSGLASLINPTGKAAEMLSGFGINLKGIVDANQGNVKGIVIDFAKALDTLDPLNRAQAIEQLFGKFQFARLSTLFQNVIKEGNQASRVLKLTNATTEELAILSERELKKVEDSPMFKFQKAVEDIKVTLVPLGEAFLKAVTPVLEFGTKILEKFNDLDAGAKQFVVGLTAIGGVIGPVFLMGFGLVANGIANLIKMFVFFKTSLNKAGSASTQLGMQTDYMTQQQLEASAVAASLDQIHTKLIQTFTSETAAVNNLTAAYRRTLAAQSGISGGAIGRTRAPKKYASGVISVPGPKGAGDVVPAMLSPGEAVIPAKQAKKYSGIVSSLISDNVPGFRFGRNPFASMLGRSRVGVRMQSQNFSEALASGNRKYQSGFATGIGDDFVSKRGVRKPKQKRLRTDLEQNIFGLPASTSPGNRPTFGFASSSILQSILNRILFGKAGSRASAAMNPRSSSLDRYGDISLITKGSVAKRSTAYAGDILLDYSRNKNLSGSTAPMRGATKDQLQAAQFGRFNQPFGNIQTGKNQFTTNPKPPYIETYTPGGFDFKEIDKIIARDPKVAKLLKSELRNAGLSSVRVTGSNFAARLFRALGIPGYKDGTKSVKAISDIKSKLTDTLRTRPEAFKQAYENLGYASQTKEQNIFLDSYQEELKKAKPGITQLDFDKAVNNYLGYDLSHLRDTTKQVKLADGSMISAKIWNTQDIIKESRAVNQVLENISTKGHIGANGKNLGRGTFLPNLNIKEIAKMAGVSEAIAAKELQNLQNKVHPTTRDATKVLSAVSQKYGGPRGTALSKLLKFRLMDNSPGSFFNAIKNGTLSLGPNRELNEKAIRTQESKINLANKKIEEAKSTTVSSTTGSPKPSRVSRKGGSPRDSRMVATSPGEVILSNKSVKAIGRGGTARVGRLNLANIIPGREDGQPSGQRQRGPDGRFVSSKSQAAAGGSGVKRPGMGGGMASMVASGAVMAGSMMPGPVGKMSQDLMMPVMMASMILPMLKGPVQIAVAALAAIAVAGFALKGAFDEAQDKSMKLAESMGGSQKAIEGYAEFSGKVSAGQIMDRRRSQSMSPFAVQPGKTTYGQAFAQSEQGQALTSSTRESISAVGKAGTQSQLVNQLVTAVSSGALDAGQARSIVANLATEINDYSFGMNVNAKLIELLGPNGENLVKDPLAVRVKMAEDTRRQNATVGASLTKTADPFGRLGQAALQTGAMAGTGAMIGAAVSGPLAPVGAAAGAVAGTVAGIALNAGSVVDSFVKMGTASGAVVASGILALQQQQELVDSLDVEYERRIASAKAAGDVEAAERLTTEHINARNSMLAENAKTTAAVLENYKNAGFGQGAMNAAVDKAIERKYEDDPIMQALAVGAKDQITAASGLDNTQEYQMKLLVATGDLDPMVVSQLLGTFASDGEQLTKVLNLMTNLGSADGNKAIQLMNMFVDKDGNPIKDQQTKFIANVESKTPAQAKKYLDLFTEISKTSGVMDAQVAMTFYNNNPKAAQEFQQMMDKINSVDGKMSMDFVQNLIGAEQFEQFKKNQVYFDSLDPEQQKRYMSVFTNTMQLEGDKAMQDAYKLWLTEPGNAKKMFEEFAVAKSVQVTEASKEALAPKQEVENTSSGGGRKADPLDNILKALQNVRKASINALGGATELFKLFENGKNISVFEGIENQLLDLTSNTDFANFIAGLDKEEQGLFITIKNGNVQLKERGRLLEKAYRAKSIGQFVISQKQAVLASKDELTARNLLIKAGYSYAEALDLSRDATIAAAYADAAATKGADNKRKAIEAVTKALREGLAAQKSTRSLDEIFDEGFSKAMEAFEAEENRLTLEFGVKIKADKALVAAAENEIAKIQYIIDDYDADLRGIEDQEEKINKTYDDKLDSLEKVRVANQKILDQEKGKLSVAEAITRGDLAAAAQAAQQVRESSASGYFASQTTAIQAAREKALGQVRGSGGLSRIQIEEKIKKLSDDILYIEEKTLEPANERIRLAQVELDKQIQSITVLGRTKTEWDTIKSGIDIAKVSSDAYKKSIEEALAVVEQLKLAWAGVAPPGTPPPTDPPPTDPPVTGKDDNNRGKLAVDSLTAEQKKVAELQKGIDELKFAAGNAKNKLAAAEYVVESKTKVLPSKGGVMVTNTATQAEKDKVAGLKIEQAEIAKSMAMLSYQQSKVAAPAAAAKPASSAAKAPAKKPVMRASGGIIPKYFVNGGLSRGTDTVPAMLTPGEFIVSKFGVKDFGINKLKAINSGTYDGSSVYNYNLSVNVSSMSDPNDIAQTVMSHIRKVESQRIRSNKF